MPKYDEPEEYITQNSYERRHKQSTIPPALTKYEEMKQRPIQTIQARKYREQRKIPKRNYRGCCGQQTWTPQHNSPAKTVKCNN